MARALKYDANLIYEYVYTNIEFDPTYGSFKGPLGTLLDGRGNDTDQANLMVALLRQSGYTANFVHGSITLAAAQLSNWLRTVPSQVCPVEQVLAQAGVIYQVHTSGSGDCSAQTLISADIEHVWVSVTGGSFGSNTYVYDPSVKTYGTTSTGINLAAAIGYTQSDFLSAAQSGATITTNSVQNLNRSNIRSKLAQYAANLTSYIRTNIPTATTNDVIGGSYIQPLSQPYFPQTSLPYETPGDVPEIWTTIPDWFRTIFEVQIGGADLTYFSDQVYAHRLSIVYDSSARPVLYLDGVPQATGSSGSSALTYKVTFQFCWATTGPSSPDCATGYTDMLNFQSNLQAASGNTFSIVMGFGDTGRGMVEYRRRQLQANRATGGSDTSEPVLGETLNLLGYSWLAQQSAAYSLYNRLVGTRLFTQCYIGVAAQTLSPYIDMPGGFIGVASLSNAADRWVTSFYGGGNAGSALEGGLIDQNLAKNAVGGVSTVRLFDVANTGGTIIFDATSSNWSSISSQLTGYSSADYAQVASFIGQGYRVLVPKTGNLNQNNWSGAAYLAIGPTPPGGSGPSEIAWMISTRLHGGYSDEDIAPPAYVNNVVETSDPPEPPPTQVSKDPIDLSSGAFLYDHDDLSIGSTDFPVGLTFRRSYSSNNLYQKTALGPGWTHGFAITALPNSDGLKGMGQDSPIDAAAAIAASFVAQDLISDSAKPLLKLVVSLLVQRWTMDQLTNNTVNVIIGPQTEQFMLLADGSYNPRLGSSDRLALGGGYTFQYKDGTTIGFNSAGNISSWQNTSGATVSFSYDSSTPPLLISVSNSFGRTLNLSYNTSKQLTSVADNSSPARSVSYGYDSAGNLNAFTDPNGNSTTFAYRAFGGTSLLTQTFYPSTPTIPFATNIYDSLGRVMTQTNAIGGTWSYFFAGYRSEEDDPNGTQHVLYYNPRGKVQFDIQDYAGLDLVTSMLYDGLDRPSLMTLPEGGTTSYSYATTTNPWANNVATVVRTPKPGSLLSTQTTNYSYDATFNKPTSITDPLGLVNTLSYDPATGNLVSTVADSGSAPHFNARTGFTYTSLGLLASMTDPVGILTQYAYDGFGNRTSRIVDPGSGGHVNQTTAYGYDSVGNVTSLTDANNHTTTSTYDAARRVLTTKTPATVGSPFGILTTNTYDADGKLLQVQQSSNGAVLRTTSATYTPSGKPATATDANGNTTSFAYDLLDRRITITDPMNRATQFTYDALSRPYRTYNTVIQAGPLSQQTWTADGVLASLADSNGNTTGFAYDGFDRLAVTTYPLSSTETYGYDADGNVTSRTTRAGDTLSFVYDTLNRLCSKTVSTSPTACNGTAGASFTVIYGYDLVGRPTSITDNSASLAAIVPPGGGSSASFAASYSYDALNRPLSVSWTPAPTATAPGANSSVAFGHSYNKANQRVGQTVSDNAWFSYPTAASSTSYSANSLNQYTAVGAITPTYDNNGNLTSDGTFTFAYDAENRLVSATKTGLTASYTFDGRGRRKSRTVNGTTTVSVTDADNREVLEYDGSTGAVLRWYAYGLGPNDVVGQMNVPANTRLALIPDIQGSVIGTMDTSAASLSPFGYRPYGGSSSTPAQFAYTGQRIDTESGLYYYRARHYSPAWGRFMQADPGGYPTGLLLYAYVGNDPLNAIDPTGMAQGPAGNDQTTTSATIAPFGQTSTASTSSAGGGTIQVGDPGTPYRVVPMAGTPVGPYGDPYVPNAQLNASAQLVLQSRAIFYNPGTSQYSVGFDLSAAGTITPSINRRGPDSGNLTVGFIYSPPGAPAITPGENPQSAVRVGFANAVTGLPYFQVYNANGQLISPITGGTVSTATSHYPIGSIGPTTP